MDLLLGFEKDGILSCLGQILDWWVVRVYVFGGVRERERAVEECGTVDDEDRELFFSVAYWWLSIFI